MGIDDDLLCWLCVRFGMLFTDTVIGHAKEVGQEDMPILSYFGSLRLGHDLATLFGRKVVHHVRGLCIAVCEDMQSCRALRQLSMHTLFRSVTGGYDWGEMADLLIAIDWVWGYFFTGYIAFSYFAVLNVITDSRQNINFCNHLSFSLRDTTEPT